MDRLEAQKYLMKCIEEDANQNGWDIPVLFATRSLHTSRSWTNREMYVAIESDTIPRDYPKNPIDEYLSFVELIKKMK